MIFWPGVLLLPSNRLLGGLEELNQTGGGDEFTIWVGETENYEGVISIESTTNEPMEINFPRQQ